MKRRTLTAILTGILALALLTLGSLAQAVDDPSPETEVEGKLMLLLDASGSMRETTSDGVSRIDAARDALHTVVDALPDNAQVGMRVFGANFSSSDPRHCEDTDLVVPVGTIDRPALTEAIEAYEPHGHTPIGAALLAAAEDLGDDGTRTIILLSDGESNCDPAPCPVVEDLIDQGLNITVDVVGLNVNQAAREELSCIANASGGAYYGVESAEQLASSLLSLSVRTFRGFEAFGERIAGGPIAQEALALKPGQYVDTVRGPGENRYYRVEVPPGGGVAVSATARPGDAEGDLFLRQALSITIQADDGTICATDTFERRANWIGLAALMTTSAYWSPLIDLNEPACLEADEVIVLVHDEGAQFAYDYELVVTTAPEIVNRDDLPEAIEEPLSYIQTANADGDATPVVGSGSFSDAPLLETGIYRDSIRPGEQLIYRVNADWGQSPRVTWTLEADEYATSVIQFNHQNRRAIASVASPLRQYLGPQYDVMGDAQNVGTYSGRTDLRVTAAAPEVRVLNVNQEELDYTTNAMAGDYYFMVELAALDDTEAVFAAPMTITVQVVGSTSGVPEFATGEIEGIEDAGSTETTTDDGSSGLPWLWILIGTGVAVLLILIAALWLWLRARRKAASSATEVAPATETPPPGQQWG